MVGLVDQVVVVVEAVGLLVAGWEGHRAQMVAVDVAELGVVLLGIVDVGEIRFRVVRVGGDASRGRLRVSGGQDPARFWLHKLRDSFASWCLRRKIDLRTIQAWLGHESIEMTARYLATLPDAEQGQKINEAFRDVLAPSAAAQAPVVREHTRFRQHPLIGWERPAERGSRP